MNSTSSYYPGSYPGGFNGYPQQGQTQQPTGQTIGNGSVKVALLLPFSGEGASAASVATLFQNSAQMALSDFPGADLQILVKDTAGTADGARVAAETAVQEGAELVIGPVFADAVRGASQVTRRSGVPMVAFSTDVNVADQGTYLLSYLPQSDVNRVVSYAIEQERQSFSALLPDNSYGAVVEATFRQAVGNAGGRVVAIERYTPGNAESIREKVMSLSRSVSQVDTLYIPEGGAVPSYAMQVMTEIGANVGEVKLIGSGLWNTPEVLSSPFLVGAWFPGPDNRSFDQFAERYAQTYGSKPARNASLAYDATILAAGLVKSAGPDRFSERILTNRDGFLGIDGVFRFNRYGHSDRGLAIYTPKGHGEVEVLAAAPRSFAL
ncbi:penicillin-binding protein activator [Rhodobacteraceae bacterium RKSG542]|nr:penicillin-binding protein activator [Pseudovibrio flavus]